MSETLPSRVYRYVRSGDEPVRTVIVGGFLWYFGVFFAVPTVFVMGYLVRVVRTAGRDGETLPPFDRWRELFVDGVRAYVVFGVYLLLPVLNLVLVEREVTEPNAMLLAFVVVLTGGGIFAILLPFGIEFLETSPVTVSVDGLGPVTEQPSVFLLLLLVWYVVPAALANVARERTLRSGFEFDAIRRAILHRRYAAAWLVFFPLWWSTVLWWRLPWFDQFAAFFAVRGQPSVGGELASVLVVAALLCSFLLLTVAFAVLGVAWNSLHPSEERTEPGPVPGTGTGEDADAP